LRPLAFHLAHRCWVWIGPCPALLWWWAAPSRPALERRSFMKRWIVFLALTLVATGVATAQPTHSNIGLGFHNVQAPLGVRWWFTGQKVALDAGIGFGSHEDPATDEDLSDFAFDIGVPIRLKSWDRVHFMVRPGILYTSEEEVIDFGPPVDTDNTTSMTVQAELEVEVFLAESVSFSAAH